MRISEAWNALSDPAMVPRLFAAMVVFVLLAGMATTYTYQGDKLYPKVLNPESPLDPYDRGGIPLRVPGDVKAQYPENSPKLGWITSYLTPLTAWLAEKTPHLGTTIVSHPGGIIDEILYYTRGLDTVLETSILMMAFIVASWLITKED